MIKCVLHAKQVAINVIKPLVYNVLMDTIKRLMVPVKLVMGIASHALILRLLVLHAKVLKCYKQIKPAKTLAEINIFLMQIKFVRIVKVVV